MYFLIKAFTYRCWKMYLASIYCNVDYLKFESKFWLFFENRKLFLLHEIAVKMLYFLILLSSAQCHEKMIRKFKIWKKKRMSLFKIFKIFRSPLWSPSCALPASLVAFLCTKPFTAMIFYNFLKSWFERFQIKFLKIIVNSIKIWLDNTFYVSSNVFCLGSYSICSHHAICCVAFAFVLQCGDQNSADTSFIAALSQMKTSSR